MKKLTTIGLLSVCAAGAYAQGTVTFNNSVPNTVVAPIYSPNPASPGVEQTGNSASGFPVGTTVYGGQLIGGSTGAGLNYANGNQFTAQIYAVVNVSGPAQPFSSLQPVSQYMTTLATSSTAPGAGFVIQPTFPVSTFPNGDPGIPNTGYDSVNQAVDNRATISLVAWYNAGGSLTSMAAASAAGMPYGFSTPFNLGGLGEPASVTDQVGDSPSQPRNMVGLTSFSLVSPTVTPEPSTIALGVMGLGAFLARRRKK